MTTTRNRGAAAANGWFLDQLMLGNNLIFLLMSCLSLLLRSSSFNLLPLLLREATNDYYYVVPFLVCSFLCFVISNVAAVCCSFITTEYAKKWALRVCSVATACGFIFSTMALGEGLAMRLDPLTYIGCFVFLWLILVLPTSVCASLYCIPRASIRYRISST